MQNPSVQTFAGSQILGLRWGASTTGVFACAIPSDASTSQQSCKDIRIEAEGDVDVEEARDVGIEADDDDLDEPKTVVLHK
ncbi:10605_t:CDS:2 [Funneliformis mosseae]|uniref:10605_t:CDS:1 n=1 Tax=Funneliformis mosseae TaxID=27381 RepID=A0A9N9DQU7_FUNMO|nr:10605_t:CDS:2 [Funneliformis mosseae]